MDKFTVACVQMQMRLHASLDDYRDDLRRFLRAAAAKQARLVLFPELAGQMLAPLLLGDTRSNLLRRAEVGRRRNAGAWDKVSGKAAGWLANALKADLGAATAGLLDVEPARLWEVYADLFGGLARAQGTTIVAPSAWLPDPAGAADGGPALRNLSGVFGPAGDLLGTQARVLSDSDDGGRVGRGSGWRVIPTEVGRVGLILGSDVLYPEVGRVLAYQNAEVLLLQAASPTTAGYHKLRAGILARMQDNQLYAAASFLVGSSPYRKQADPYLGRSAVLAPQELTPKYNGVLVEMGSAQSEGVITAEWDYVLLKQLWETSDTPLRRALEPADAAPLLAALYTQLQALPQAPPVQLLPEPLAQVTAEIDLDDASEMLGPASGGVVGAEVENAESEALLELDDLPQLGSVRSHWPLQPPEVEGAVAEEVMVEAIATDAPTDVEWTSPRSYAAAESTSAIRRDDETDEMDAVENQLAPAQPEEIEPGAVNAETQFDRPPEVTAESTAPPVGDDAPAKSSDGESADEELLPAGDEDSLGGEAP